MYRANLNKKNTTKIVLLTVIAVLGIVLVTSLLVKKNQDNRQAPVTTADTIEQVNFDPPSEEVISETEAHKSGLSDQDKPDTSADTKNVEPVIVSAGEFDGVIEINSYVPSIVENGGVCRATVRSSSGEHSAEANAEKDVSKTLCPTITFDKNLLSNGSWQVVVTYTSDSHSGKSAEKTFEVQ